MALLLEFADHVTFVKEIAVTDPHDLDVLQARGTTSHYLSNIFHFHGFFSHGNRPFVMLFEIICYGGKAY